jgi:hypothetical protein
VVGHRHAEFGVDGRLVFRVGVGKNNKCDRTLAGAQRGRVEKHINSILSKLGVTFEPDANRRVMAVLRWLSEAG